MTFNGWIACLGHLLGFYKYHVAEMLI